MANGFEFNYFAIRKIIKTQVDRSYRHRQMGVELDNTYQNEINSGTQLHTVKVRNTSKINYQIWTFIKQKQRLVIVNAPVQVHAKEA